MTTPFDEGYVPGRSKKKIATLVVMVAVAVLSLVIAGPYLYAVGKGTAGNGSCGAQATGTGLVATSQDCVNVGVAITYQQDIFPRYSMLQQGFTPSCWAFCHGITYVMHG
jgi:hypothetical protein